MTTCLARFEQSPEFPTRFTGAHTWILGMYPDGAQDELRESDPDTILPGSLAASGRAQIADDSFRVSGRWQFASGCNYGRWALLCATQSHSTCDDPKHAHFLVPSGDFTIKDTWHTLRLRGTGSKDIVMEDVCVPISRSMSTGELFESTSEHARPHKSLVYQFPVLCSLSFLLTAPVLALTRRIYDEFAHLTSSRRDHYNGSSKARKATTQFRVAESWSELECAELLVKEVATIYDDARRSRKPFDAQTRIEIRMRASYAVTLCRRSADRLYDAAGTNAIYERSPLLPLMPTLHAASHHAAADFDNNGTAFGSQTLGLGPGTILF